jgi:hypothetical protein
MEEILIEVHGFVMLKGLNDGFKYLLIQKKHPEHGLIYEVRKPMGKKLIVSHYKSSVDLWIKEPGKQNNYIEILSKITKQ